MTDLTAQAIAILKRNGRASYSEIARELGTNRDCVASRINPLLKSGKLRIIAVVAPKVRGVTTYAHLAIKAEGDLQRIISVLERSEHAVLIATVTGPFQIAVELQLRSIIELRSFVAAVRAIRGVREIDVHLHEHIHTSFFAGPEPDAHIHLDDMDKNIVNHLLRDGRANFADIAQEVGLSVSGCRSRVQRLLSSGAVQIGAVKQRSNMTSELVFGFGVSARGDSREAINIIASSLGVEFIARSVGRFDVLARLEFCSLQDFNLLMSRLRSLPSVDYCEQWLYVRIVRAQYFPAVTRARVRVHNIRTAPAADCCVDG